MENNNSFALFSSLFDQGTFVELSPSHNSKNIFTGFGSVFGKNIYAFFQNSSFKSGAINSYAVSKINKVYQLALKTGCPVIGFYDSKGTQLEDELASLEALNSWMSNANNLSGVVPQISVVLGNCSSTQAMIAVSGDFVIIKKDANLNLYSSYITAIDSDSNVAMKEGLIHAIADDDRDIIDKTRKLTTFIPSNNLSTPNHFDFKPPLVPTAYNLTGRKLIDSIADLDSGFELMAEYDHSTIACFATLEGKPVAFIATDKKRVTKNGANKISRFIRFCDCFSIPIITLFDSPGFEKDSSVRSLKAASALSHCYMEATCPKVCVVVGEAFGMAYLTFASKGSGNDFVFCYDNVSISAISPQAHIELFGDKNASSKQDLILEYKKTKASPASAENVSIVDNIITPSSVRECLVSSLMVLEDKSVARNPKKHSNIIF